MAGARVIFDPRHEFRFEVEGLGELRFDEDAVLGPMEVAGPASATSLTRALTRHLRYLDGDAPYEDVHVRLSLTPARYYDHDFSPTDRVSLCLSDGRLLIELETTTEVEPDLDAIERLLTPMLRRNRTEFVGGDIEVLGEVHLLRITVGRPTSGRTVEELWRFGKDIEILVEAGQGGELVMWSALDVLRAGRWDVLYGQPESDWLEAKRDPYDTRKPNWRYELAKDVAAFANRPDGGLIVLGLTTRDAGDGDTITGHREFELRAVRRQTYRNAVAQLVYPRVAGFAVERLPGSTNDHGLVVLIIPKQSEAGRPYVVQGILRQGKVLGAHVLLPVRREDDVALMDVAGIHARLRLGEQVIEGRWRPLDPPGNSESPRTKS